MRWKADTARLPSAIHSTKTATTIAKVNWEEPKARPPIRLKVVCSVIIANPASRATAAQVPSLGIVSTTADVAGSTAIFR